MSKGYVYILSNESMPGLVKIGRTTRSVNERANELYQTGVPTPFKVEHEVLSPDCCDLEARIHESLLDVRVSPGREFFEFKAHEAGSILDQLLREQVEEWLGEYIPDHSIVEHDFAIDPSSLLIIASVTGMPYPDVRCVLEEIRCDDETFDFEALRHRLEARRARNRAARLQKSAAVGITLQ